MGGRGSKYNKSSNISAVSDGKPGFDFNGFDPDFLQNVLGIDVKGAPNADDALKAFDVNGDESFRKAAEEIIKAEEVNQDDKEYLEFMANYYEDGTPPKTSNPKAAEWKKDADRLAEETAAEYYSEDVPDAEEALAREFRIHHKKIESRTKLHEAELEFQKEFAQTARKALAKGQSLEDAKKIVNTQYSDSGVYFEHKVFRQRELDKMQDYIKNELNKGEYVSFPVMRKGYQYNVKNGKFGPFITFRGISLSVNRGAYAWAKKGTLKAAAVRLLAAQTYKEATDWHGGVEIYYQTKHARKGAEPAFG